LYSIKSQTVLNRQITQLVQGLKDIDHSKAAVSKLDIPIEVFDYIDQGKNPGLYTKHCIERALERNEQVKGKIEVYNDFRQELISQLSHVYPKLIETYKEARKDSK
jgi:mediator of RNA polymerase II transcription subunit 10